MKFNSFDLILDSRNKELWNDLNNYFEIVLFLHDKPFSEMFSKHKKVQIYVNKDINSASFTHELLHLWIEQKGIYLGSSFRLLVKENKKLNRVFSDNLLMHIGNTCDHVKMFPKFISLGFNSNEFLYDNDIHKCSESDILTIEKKFKFLWKYRAKAIDAFIGKFFAVSADNNLAFDYSNCQKRLEKLDFELFKLLNNFWNQWLNYDLDKEDGVYISYHQIVFDFFDSFERWIKDKKLIKYAP
jgi:hypothetical protein